VQPSLVNLRDQDFPGDQALGKRCEAGDGEIDSESHSLRQHKLSNGRIRFFFASVRFGARTLGWTLPCGFLTISFVLLRVYSFPAKGADSPVWAAELLRQQVVKRSLGTRDPRMTQVQDVTPLASIVIICRHSGDRLFAAYPPYSAT